MARNRSLQWTLSADATPLQRALANAERKVGQYAHANETANQRVGRSSQQTSAKVRHHAEESVAANALLTKSFHGMARSAVTAGAGFAGAYIGFAKAKAAITTTTELAHATEILHRNTGLSIKSASEWTAVAQVRGIAATALGMSFTKLSAAVQKATTATAGNADQQRALATLQKNSTPQQAAWLKTVLESKKGTLGYSQALAHLTGSAGGYNSVGKSLLSTAMKSAHGANAQAEAFKKLGITQADLKRGQTDFNFLIGKVADGFGRLHGGTERQATALALLGRGWQSVLPLFEQGNKSLQEQLRLADKYHVTLDGKTIKSTLDLVQAQRELKFASLGVQVQFASGIAPALIKAEMAAGAFMRVISDPKMTSDQKWKAVEGQIGSLVKHIDSFISNEMPKIADTVGREAPHVAGAFVHGFLNAGPMGELVLTGWLLERFGGMGAFAAIGRRGGAAFSTGFAETSAIGGWGAGAGAAGGAMAGGAAAGRGGQLLYGRGFRYGAPVSQLGRQSYGLGRVGSAASRLGRGAMGVVAPLATYAPAAVAAGGAYEIYHLATEKNKFGMPGGGTGFEGTLHSIGDFARSGPDMGPLRKFSDSASKQLDKLTASHNAAGLEKLAATAHHFALAFPEYAKNLDKYAKVATQAAHSADKATIAAGQTFERSHRFQSTGGMLNTLLKEFPKLSTAGRNAGAQSMIEMSRGLEKNGKLPKGSTDRLIKGILAKYPALTFAIQRAGADSMKHLATAFKDRRVTNAVQSQIDTIGKTWDDAPKLAKTNATNARQNWQREMDFLKHKIATSTGDQRKVAQQQWDAMAKYGKRTSSVMTHQMIRDAESAAKNTGHQYKTMSQSVQSAMGSMSGAVLSATSLINKKTNAELHAFGSPRITFSTSTGRAQGGYIGQPGEAGGDNIPIVVGRGEAVLNRHQQAPVESALQMVYGMGLDDLFGQIQRPHYMAKGGKVRGYKSGGYVFPFPKGEKFSWNRIDQGQDLQGPPGGPVLAIAPGMISSGHDRFGGFGDRYPLEAISAGPLKGRSVYYGHAHTTHTGPVRAGDQIGVTQSRANTWTAAPAGWLELGFLPYGSMSAGNAIAPILHSIAGNRAIAGQGGGAAKIPRVLIKGPAGALHTIAQSASDKARAAAQKYLDRKTAAMPSAAGVSGGMIGGIGPGGKMSAQAVDAVRRKAGLPPIFDRISYAESGDDPGVVNSIGATGLWQILGHPDLVRRFGDMRVPWNNARAAKVLYTQSGLSPWAASRGAWGKFLGIAGGVAGGGHARGGFVGRRFSPGGRVRAAGVLSNPPPKGPKPPGTSLHWNWTTNRYEWMTAATYRTLQQRWNHANPSKPMPTGPAHHQVHHKPPKARHWDPFRNSYEMLTAPAYHHLIAKWQHKHPKARMPGGPAHHAAATNADPFAHSLFTNWDEMWSGLEEPFDAALAVATLNDDIPGEIAAQKGIVGLDATQFAEALKSGDPAKIASAATKYKGDKDTLGVISGQTTLVDAIKALTDEIKTQNKLISTVQGTANGEALRMLADVLSGQIGGNVRRRGAVPGAGQVARV